MALNGLVCAEVLLRNYSLTLNPITLGAVLVLYVPLRNYSLTLNPITLGAVLVLYVVLPMCVLYVYVFACHQPQDEEPLPLPIFISADELVWWRQCASQESAVN